jgi:solute carrier family 25 (mitochondrial iron transporter), member 28/37
MVTTNETVRTYLNPNHEHRIEISLLAGSIAGATAAFITTPLDLIKTRLQIQNLKPCPVLKGSTTSSTVNSINSNNTRLIQTLRSTTTASSNATKTLSFESIGNIGTTSMNLKFKYSNMISVLRSVLREEGLFGLYRGATLRMLVHAPSVAISWTAYDTAKRILAQKDNFTKKYF